MVRAANAVERLLADAGATVSIATVAQCYGIHRQTAYDLAQRGELGVPVLRLGRRLRVPTAELRRTLGLAVEPGGEPAA